MTGATRHIEVDGDRWRDLPALVATAPPDDEVLVSVTGASTCAIVAALADGWTRAVGVWLTPHTTHEAALCARDVATLSWLVDLRAVVVAGDAAAGDFAQIVAALLSGEAATVETPAGSVRHAFNRPAPRAPIAIAFTDRDAAEGVGQLVALAPAPGVRLWTASLN